MVGNERKFSYVERKGGGSCVRIGRASPQERETEGWQKTKKKAKREGWQMFATLNDSRHFYLPRSFVQLSRSLERAGGRARGRDDHQATISRLMNVAAARGSARRGVSTRLSGGHGGAGRLGRVLYRRLVGRNRRLVVLYMRLVWRNRSLFVPNCSLFCINRSLFVLYRRLLLLNRGHFISNKSHFPPNSSLFVPNRSSSPLIVACSSLIGVPP